MAKKQASDPVGDIKAVTASLRALSLTLKESRTLKAELAALRAENERLRAGLLRLVRALDGYHDLPSEQTQAGAIQLTAAVLEEEEATRQARALLEAPDET